MYQLFRDEVLNIYEEVDGGEPIYNPIWYRVWGGFVHRGRLHKVKSLYNQPPNISVGKMTPDPGQSTFVETPEFMMHQGMDGPHDFAIHHKTNDPKTPEMLVHVLTDWGP